jgi:hypothetical protein
MLALKLTAYLSPYATLKAHQLHGAAPEEFARSCYITSHDPGKDYTPVADVECSVHLFQASDIVGNKIAALKATQEAIRAKASAEDTRLEGEIQSLLSISMNHKEGN